MAEKERASMRRTSGPAESNSSAGLRKTGLRVVQPSNDEDDGFEIEVHGHRELVPDGWYDAKFVGHYTAIMFGGVAPKVFLRFEIVQPGQYMGIRLLRPYRARTVVTSGERGKFTLDGGGDLFRMLARVLDVKQRRDRITLIDLKRKPLTIRTRTVKVGRDKQPLAGIAQYSVVQDIEHA